MGEPDATLKRLLSDRASPLFDEIERKRKLTPEVEEALARRRHQVDRYDGKTAQEAERETTYRDWEAYIAATVGVKDLASLWTLINASALHRWQIEHFIDSTWFSSHTPPADYAAALTEMIARLMAVRDEFQALAKSFKRKAGNRTNVNATPLTKARKAKQEADPVRRRWREDAEFVKQWEQAEKERANAESAPIADAGGSGVPSAPVRNKRYTRHRVRRDRRE
jgi:hypothetical protein